jgi:GrpB-like predicted nucleotidyltransferase (UPF0157 family)
LERLIEIVDYDLDWAAQFELLRQQYERALAGVVILGIEHVGSTSVPGLAAKPVIDIDIVVSADQAPRAIEAMERVGFSSLGELGIPDRWALHAPSDLSRTNTYVVTDGSLALRNHLAVRDQLRSDVVLRDEYAALKRAIAASVQDIDEYVGKKSKFLSMVLARAGLTAEEREAIEIANRSQ